MKIIQLPSVLPGNLDLTAINEQLKNRTAQLDWSSVISANEQHLAVLLNGLSLDDSEVIDLENPTMSDNIAQKVVHFFSITIKILKTIILLFYNPKLLSNSGRIRTSDIR